MALVTLWKIDKLIVESSEQYYRCEIIPPPKKNITKKEKLQAETKRKFWERKIEKEIEREKKKKKRERMWREAKVFIKVFSNRKV